MKRSGVLAALCLLVLAVFTVGAGKWQGPQQLKGGTGSTDSLTANPETLETITLPDQFDSAFAAHDHLRHASKRTRNICRARVRRALMVAVETPSKSARSR